VSKTKTEAQREGGEKNGVHTLLETSHRQKGKRRDSVPIEGHLPLTGIRLLRRKREEGSAFGIWLKRTKSITQRGRRWGEKLPQLDALSGVAGDKRVFSVAKKKCGKEHRQASAVTKKRN